MKLTLLFAFLIANVQFWKLLFLCDTHAFFPIQCNKNKGTYLNVEFYAPNYILVFKLRIHFSCELQNFTKLIYTMFTHNVLCLRSVILGLLCRWDDGVKGATEHRELTLMIAFSGEKLVYWMGRQGEVFNLHSRILWSSPVKSELILSAAKLSYCSTQKGKNENASHFCLPVWFFLKQWESKIISWIRMEAVQMRSKNFGAWVEAWYFAHSTSHWSAHTNYAN